MKRTSELLALLFVGSTAAHADVIEWVGYQSDSVCAFDREDTDASFHHGGQWFNFLVPQQEDVAVFDDTFDPMDNGMPSVVHFGEFYANSATGFCNDVYVSAADADVGNIQIRSGSFRFELEGQHLQTSRIAVGIEEPYAPQPSTPVAELTIAGGSVDMPQGTSIGVNNSARLVLENGGTMNSGQELGGSSIGVGSGEFGEVVIRGNESTWTTTTLNVGNSGTGELHVLAGGQVIGNRDAHIGRNPGSSGSATVTGSEASWRPDNLHVGLHGQGSLRVAAGGSVQTDFLILGELAGSAGDVEVTGSGTSVQSRLHINVGRLGQGNLGIYDGASVQSATAGVGVFSGSEGEVELEGLQTAPASWQVDTNFTIGGSTTAQGGTGALKVGFNSQVTVGRALTIWQGSIVDTSTGGAVKIGQGDRGTSEEQILVLSNGVLSGNGTVIGDVLVDGGMVLPGPLPGALTVNGNFHKLSTGNLVMEIGGTTPATGYDQLEVSGNLNLDGAVQISFVNGFLPRLGDTFELFSAGGDFMPPTTLSVLNLPPGFDYVSAIDNGVFSLEVTDVAFPSGDYNFNGVVDAADYTVWRNTLGQTGSGLDADGNGNGEIDDGDYAFWKSNFGQTAGSGSSQLDTTRVPEPNVPAGVLAAAIAAVWNRRRGRFANSAARKVH